MSAVDKYMNMIEEEEDTVIPQPRKSFQEIRTEVIDYLENHLWVMEKECKYLDNRTDARTEKNFNAKGKYWAWVIKGAKGLVSMYK